ncbi:MAG: sugar transferase [Planctomycetota bacterium]|jgi:lipopolysaccharide/colanic/teichoic acid biosynthesis glycosyltransferase
MSVYTVSKRVFDVFLCAPAIILLLPVFCVLALIIRLESKGPAIFKQERAGQGGKPFIFYKFRTMKLESEPFGPSPKSGEDSRLTRVGRFLREYSLDELPQLFNIVKGDMSLVGPRPLYLSQMREWNEREKTRLLVRPGLTGLAQVSGRGELKREEKLELDARYVETAGLGLDVKIVLATVGQVFGRKSIYEKSYSETERTRGDTDE